MKFVPAPLPGVIVVEPRVFRDHRGFFLETWHAQRFLDAGIGPQFVQDNHSMSVGGTLRGLHGQLTRPQGKLVRVTEGAIFDVAVDARVGSPAFGRWFGTRLDAAQHHQLWVPPGFVHGFCVITETAHVIYKCTEYYAPDDEITVRWDDPAIGITWPADSAPVLSPRDAEAPLLAELRAAGRLPVFKG